MPARKKSLLMEPARTAREGDIRNECRKTTRQPAVKFYKLVRQLCFAALLTIAMNAFARPDIPGYPTDVTANDPREIAMLPKYCIHTRTFRGSVPGANDPGEIKRLRAVLGSTYDALHHYCWGLMKTNRALYLVKDKQRKEFYLRDAISDYNYVLVRASSQFPLLPEVLTKKGENLVLLRDSTAELELLRAIELKRDYWPAYGALSDHYKNTGQLAKAKEILEKGLSEVPDAKALSARLAQLRSRSATEQTKTTATVD